MHIPVRRSEYDSLTGRRRLATADFGNEQSVVGATHIGEGGFAETFDQFDDAFHGEGTVPSPGKMLRTNADRQRIAHVQ